MYGSTSPGLNIFLLFLVGFLANGPYALITTAVSADLGSNPSIKGSSRALATVTTTKTSLKTADYHPKIR